MKLGIVTGENARDVAAYVAEAAAVAGQGHRQARRRRRRQGRGHRQGSGRDARHPRRRVGLAYKFADAEATAGSVTIKSENPQTTEHDIAVEGNGLNDKGEIVTSGGVSQFTADLKPGEYTFYCSVDGHREGGMVGKLTVK